MKLYMYYKVNEQVFCTTTYCKNIITKKWQLSPTETKTTFNFIGEKNNPVITHFSPEVLFVISPKKLSMLQQNKLQKSCLF